MFTIFELAVYPTYHGIDVSIICLQLSCGKWPTLQLRLGVVLGLVLGFGLWLELGILKMEPLD